MTRTIPNPSLNRERTAGPDKFFLKVILMFLILLAVAQRADCQDQGTTTSAEPKKIAPVDLRAGDVLLYLFDPSPWDFPNWLVDKLIVELDGGTYNHASIYDGANVVEAIGSGIVKRPLKISIAEAERVDVWRIHDQKGDELGSPGFDAKPVTYWAAQFAEKDGHYAYDRLLLLAGITATRHVDPSVGGKILQHILEQAALLLDKIVSGHRVQMICSELVYRCYLGASQTAKDSRYLLNVPQVLKSDLTGPLQAQAEQFWAKYQEAKKKDPLSPSPDFVTPYDLERSKNLVKIGRLK
jgi:hypothetical protein